jgi:hypothetical protein
MGILKTDTKVLEAGSAGGRGGVRVVVVVSENGDFAGLDGLVVDGRDVREGISEGGFDKGVAGERPTGGSVRL